jgi:tetratricopeptide (TPR) repeat protein
MNFKHLLASATIAILGLSLLPVTSANAGPLIGPKEYKLPLTESQHDLLFGFAAGLCVMSAIESAIDKKEKEKSLKSQMHLNESYVGAIESGDNYETWLNLGNTLAAKEQHEEAAKCFDRAVKHEPTADAWKGLGDALFALERWEEAVNAYNLQIRVITHHSNKQIEQVGEQALCHDELVKINGGGNASQATIGNGSHLNKWV